MKRNKTVKSAIDTSSRIKLRIDSRTIIVVKNQEALDMWRGKYPGAQIID
jgi:hypothetical protein